jgi:HPr kinase/phosphorylase
MKKIYNKTELSRVIDHFKLSAAYLPEGELWVDNSDVNRPGLPLTGFFEFFDPSRLQIVGKHEHRYMTELSPAVRGQRIREFLCQKPPAVIFTSGLDVPADFMDLAKEYGVPVLQTGRRTSEFLAALISWLNVELAPQTSVHGVLVEAYGEGILILGDSGIGKSETAIELVKRGHRLVADDSVILRRVSDHTLVGQAPEIIRHYIELRGIGIIDVKRIFGMGAVKDTGNIDLVIRFEHWEKGKMYDRLGLDTEYEDIMGIQVPRLIIPVHPGRNLAVIVEIAAMNSRQKKMGYNTAEEFNRRLIKQMEEQMEKEQK